MLADFAAAYDPAAEWNPLEAVLRVQQRRVKWIPRRWRWMIIRAWAQLCLAGTFRERRGIGERWRSREESPQARRVELNREAGSKCSP